LLFPLVLLLLQHMQLGLVGMAQRAQMVMLVVAAVVVWHTAI
jgi:hypothetical protein